MKKSKLLIPFAFLFLVIGFATISITLTINGTFGVDPNEDDFKNNILFSDFSVTSNNATITSSDTNKSITITSNKMTNIDDEVDIEYKITNNSMYDANITGINCYIVDSYENDIASTKTDKYSRYFSFVSDSDFFPVKISSKEVSDATTLKIKMIRSYVGEEDKHLYFQCELNSTTNTNEEASGDTVSNDLYELIKSEAKTDTINFSINSATSGTNGIYTTTETENDKEVYYYRGNVDNNLIFNNICWKIIRTTETGGVKLIYNGLPSSGTCNNTGSSSQLSSTSAFNSNYDDNAYVGYMYGTAGSDNYDDTHANLNDSEIKKAIDTWFSTNFTSENVKNKIEDTIYCNDRSTVAGGINNTLSSTDYGDLGYGTNMTGYGALARSSYFTESPNPSLKCPQDNDKFTVSTTNGNGALTYPVGLITLDEAVFAGFNTKASNSSDYEDTNNYLYSGSEYWTMTPIYFDNSSALGKVSVGNIYSTGSIGYGIVYYSMYDGTRPVISLASGTFVKAGGRGTTTNPYVVE